ncbi:MAG: 50S ribosomal protein L6 [Firmicutes bacterium]|jgi:large subunit ribosomal protein L6|nr:50S ribosomal protein L6 [Bacillota bacterium]MDH7496597.1 50S ribosomal protein L6 [Bacillota bacterium]
MSRIGKMPIPVPKGVEVEISGNTVVVKGPKGKLQRDVSRDVKVSLQGDKIVVERPSDDKQHRALHGLTRTLVANMVKGVTEGYEKSLVIAGTGYKAAKQGRKLVLSMGFSHPVEVEPVEGLEIEVPLPTKIVVKGIDKELVGQTAANIRAVRPPEPYKGKGIMYEGEHIRRKAGKAGKAAAGGKK